MIIAKEDTVVIRELTESDIPKLAEYANNEKVSINLRDAFPSPYTINDARRFVQMVDKQNPKTFFAIEYQGNYVGNISLSLGTDVYRKSAEIGYFIGEPFWNKGIATKAVRMIVKFGFDRLDIIRIHTGIFEFNKASQKVLEKCGFEKEAIFKKSICKKGELFDEIRFAITKKANQCLQTMTKQEQIIACENKLIDAMRNNDIPVIEELLHDDLLFTIPTGQTVTKAMDLANLRSGVMKVNKITTSNQIIGLVDDIATVAVTVHLNAIFAGNLIDADFRYLRVWKLFDTSWKVIAGSGFQI